MTKIQLQEQRRTKGENGATELRGMLKVLGKCPYKAICPESQ